MISKPEINSSGCTVWLVNDTNDYSSIFHREDGPAVIHPNGKSFWWYEGEYIDCKSQEEFERLLKLKAFL